MMMPTNDFIKVRHGNYWTKVTKTCIFVDGVLPLHRHCLNMIVGVGV